MAFANSENWNRLRKIRNENNEERRLHVNYLVIHFHGFVYR